MRRSKLVINCQPGISPVLKQEVEDLGYKTLSVDNTSVTIEGGWEEVMNLNYNLRTASRVLWMIRQFEAKDPDELYKEAKKTPWNKLIPENGHISIHSFVKNDYIRDTSFANLKLKDAIVDQISENEGKRPDSGKEKDKTVIFMFWHESKCIIYFDTSGETIAKHGYRKMPYKAPMIESLASACLRSANWHKADKDAVFVNPMCGSGTLAIEAALMMKKDTPGMLRDNYGFMHITDYDASKWHAIKNQNRHPRKIEVQNEKAPEEFPEEQKQGLNLGSGKIKYRRVTDPKIELHETPEEEVSKSIEDEVITNDSGSKRIIASDISSLAIKAAIYNAKMAGVDDMIHFEVKPFEETTIPEGDGMVMLNPEYGERLGEQEALKITYQEIGDFFKKKCKGKMGYIFTGNADLAKKIGLKTKSKTPFFNARIECRLLAYELYGGSRRES
jgi:putative N6-adenine-specific DNA methylase